MRLDREPRQQCDVLILIPASLFHPDDPFTTGIVYMPIGAAIAASTIRQSGLSVSVLDLFAESPQESSVFGELVRLGASDDFAIDEIRRQSPRMVLAYANQVSNHDSLLRTLGSLQSSLDVPLYIMENSQAVTAYRLALVKDDFLKIGASGIIAGDPEAAAQEIARLLAVEENDAVPPVTDVYIEGYVDQVQGAKRASLSAAVPAWELFRLDSYWALGYGHGPITSARYLPILTSRGCPFPCKFCVVPSTNNRKWRPREAVEVVNEIVDLIRRFDVHEFHLEDLNPTVSWQRMDEIAEELTRRQVDISWKIVAGTKIETIRSLDTLRRMADSGLSYLSMSPESGSKAVRRSIGKPFDDEFAIRVIQECRRLSIKTQACFVIGFPGETDDDRFQSLRLLKRLTRAGLDETALFIITPIPGSAIYDEFRGKFEHLSDLNFSPAWRSDFKSLNRWRKKMYVAFLTTKLLTRPLEFVAQAYRMATGSFQTKMEMVPVRGAKYWKLARQARKREQDKVRASPNAGIPTC